MAKIGIVSLIIVRFSIQNHRWKAENLTFSLNLADLTLLERPVPLLGRLWYTHNEWTMSIHWNNSLYDSPQHIQGYTVQILNCTLLQ